MERNFCYFLRFWRHVFHHHLLIISISQVVKQTEKETKKYNFVYQLMKSISTV